MPNGGKALAGCSPSQPSPSRGRRRAQSRCRGYRIKFGLFGRSENSSFPSTLRAWFAFAHASPYRKSNRNDALARMQRILNHAPLFRMTKRTNPLRDVPHPSLPQFGEGVSVVLNNFPKVREGAMFLKKIPHG